MIGKWSGDGDPLLSTTLSNQSGRRYHLTVEKLAPNTKRPIRPPVLPRYAW
jgi:hypothetical protein